ELLPRDRSTFSLLTTVIARPRILTFARFSGGFSRNQQHSGALDVVIHPTSRNEISADCAVRERASVTRKAGDAFLTVPDGVSDNLDIFQGIARLIRRE